MTNNTIDPIILGHNQFFGTNHLSASKGAEKERFFNDSSNIVDILEFSVEKGIGAFMISTHERAPEILKLINDNSNLASNISCYPLLPYITKYVKGANEKGMLNVVRDALSSGSAVEKFKILMSGGMGVLKKDLFSLIKSLVDIELLPFSNINKKAIFLHDALTDLALAYDMRDIFVFYEDFIREKYDTRPAYATKNLPALLKKFAEYGIERPFVMASINKIGFQVNPSIKEFEKAMKEHEFDLLAMSTLASGALRPREAYEYLSSLPNVSSIVVGFSNKAHGKETIDEIRKSFGQ
ncbi:MAG: hypothetical protein IIC40_04845 [Candidatus Marinimicrobia bacterium]|nr:hypothetical protein [Candidatus Neomarinimicrobiota bacterium]